ncbi:hypothetical protein E2C01_026762 [Portunus trituberculatus]|uniref:Uncharacterized protein n=1 Tax=Portunus trituberculatus TaxID=210409 RepID=A0A5B7EK39_PORTR|nr:hypothetical protein [Portunus trituberculatus]
MLGPHMSHPAHYDVELKSFRQAWQSDSCGGAPLGRECGARRGRRYVPGAAGGDCESRLSCHRRRLLECVSVELLADSRAPLHPTHRRQLVLRWPR